MSHKMEILISLLLGLYSSIHAVSQIKGISLVYNKISWPFLSDSERQAQAQLEKNERLLFNLFINLTIGYFIANELFKKFIEANHILYLFTGVQVLLFTLIAFNSFKYPQIQKTNKRFYLLSLVFPILFSYSPVAWALQRSLHGLEYSFLTYNIVSNSKTKISMAMKWLVGGVFTVILALVMLNWFQVNANVEFGSSGVIVPLIAFAFLLEYFHYYLDSQIFKFQGPSGRHLGSLLIPKR